MKFSMEGKEVELRGIARKPGKIIISNGMTKLLKKQQRGVIAQLVVTLFLKFHHCRGKHKRLSL